jgi:signal transduction histidine kinase
LAIANAGRQLTNLSIVVTELIDTAMQSVDYAFRDAQTQVHPADVSSQDTRFRLHQLFQGVVRNSPQLRSIAVFDAQGNIQVISREFPAIEHNISDRDYFHRQQDGSASNPYFVGDPTTSATTGKHTLPISQAIRDGNGAFKGIIRVGMETTYFEDLFSRVEIGQGSAITLMRTDGVVLMRSEGSRELEGLDLSRTSAFQQFLAEGSRLAWHPSPIDGSWRFVVSRKLKGAPLIVSVSLAEDEVLGPWRKQATVVAGIGAAALLILIAVCTVASRQLCKREERLERVMDQAVTANQAKSHFLANMSHELRTPINAILGFSELIGMRLLGPDISDPYLERVKLIETSAQLLIKLVNDLLDLEKIDSGNSKLTLEPFSITDLVDGCISMIASDAVQRNILISKKHFGPKSFMGDRRVVTQIFLNLLNNAVKYSGLASSITIASTIEDRELRLSVSDNGPGIPEDLLEHIFEPFQTAAAHTRRANSGSGLGLSICRKLAQLHGGTIRIESQVDLGTVIQVRLVSGAAIREGSRDSAAV